MDQICDRMARLTKVLAEQKVANLVAARGTLPLPAPAKATMRLNSTTNVLAHHTGILVFEDVTVVHERMIA